MIIARHNCVDGESLIVSAISPEGDKWYRLGDTTRLGAEARLRALGPELRRLRRARGLSQRQLGARVGIAQSQISAIERGSRLPKLRTLLAVLEVLRVTVALRIEAPDGQEDAHA
ncbi:MAG: helix-turn-helix transcriptional regulator [Thiohalocapsa sp.]|uniref:helix-turn-helix domain-containing protein n=1 Tax=Thiohalocapsa sp. TaxID=2497641 RepID=UPI0025EEBF3B|nr:helix-turn-helix transcriptional regulator [Thiohalocapsa sp.]MCG6942705.1 helix-turn-helix transcriptional regulator [Thiohalocapsa sp.]